ncbi:phage minor head protein [Methanobrevibacter sp.]|uniref:phage minor head protein n=1 Tax=Methanobrevibacter sp. TaxID=66852 RepID=UPI00389066CA
MPSQEKLIKQGIKYTDSLFDEIIRRLNQGVRASDTLEAFLEATKEYTTQNPLVTSGYNQQMLSLILQETNNHKFSRPGQKELVRFTVEQKVGEKIVDVGEDVIESVREVVKEGYNNNLSEQEIAANISEKVTKIKNKRARAIARTEVARTATVSDYIINKERGATHWYVECRNTACSKCKHAWHEGWTEANDDNFSPSDTSAEGKGWIGNKVYSMNDTSMLPPLHPNCRCVVYFITEEEIPKETTIVKDTTTTTTITDDFLQDRLSEEDYKTYRMAKSNRNFSQSLLDGNRLDERGIQLHKQSIEFYTNQIKELEDKALSNQSKTKTVDNPTENNKYSLNNRENSFSKVIITKEQFEKVVTHQSKRANATLEYGNSIDNTTGELARSTDIKGSKHRVSIPKLTKSYSIVHNHTNNNGFSGGDAFGQTEGHLQDVCYATTPKGIWIMRDTEFGKFRKQGSVDGDYELKYRMESKYKELANNGKEKYKDQYDNVKSPNEKRKIQRQMADEVTDNYNNWLLEEFAVGKRRDNLIEIEFIPIEMINNVQF